MTHSKLLMSGVVIALVAGLGWFAFEQWRNSMRLIESHEPGAPAEMEASASKTVSERRRQMPATIQNNPEPATNPRRRSTESMVSELPDFQVPPGQAIARLRVLSDAGNTEAMVQLSGRLAQCTERALRAAKSSDDSDRVTIEMDLANSKLDKELRVVRNQNGQGRIDQHAAMRSACEALPSAVRENWLDPIDEAARSGITYAMRQYANFVVDEYDSREAVVADVDRAIVRRDKARAYLQRAVSLGDAEGLADLAYAYFIESNGKPQLYAVDNYQAYLYAYAASFGERGQYRQLDWVMSQSAKSLDSGQISDARKQGKRLFDACCAKH